MCLIYIDATLQSENETFRILLYMRVWLRVMTVIGVREEDYSWCMKMTRKCPYMVKGNSRPYDHLFFYLSSQSKKPLFFDQ